MTTPDKQQTPNCAVKVYSVARASNLLTSVGYNPDDGLLRLVTTNELVWVDPRFHTRPLLALKHEREYDRSLSSHVINTGDGTRAIFSSKDVFPTHVSVAKLTVLSSRNNSLLSVYDVSGSDDGLVQSHTLPYSLSGYFPNGPHSGFCVVQPDRNSMVGSLLQLSNRGAIYQSALTLHREEHQSPTKIELIWSPGVQRLNTDSCTQKPDVGRLGAREMQEIDLRQAYQRI